MEPEPLVLDIEFGNNNLTPERIATRKILIPKDKLNFLFGLLKKRVKFNYYRLSVEVTYPDSVQVADPDELVVIKPALYEGEPASELANLPIKTEFYPFDLLLNLHQITDFTALSKSQETLQLSLKGRPSKNAREKNIEDFEVQLRFKKARPTPHYTFDIEPEFISGYEHQKEEVKLGVITIRSESSYKYTHPLDCVVHVHYGDRRHKEMVFLGSPGAVKETNPNFNIEEGGLRERGDPLKSVTQIGSAGSGGLTIQNLLTGNDIIIPVYIDLNEIENPLDDLVCTATAEFTFTIEGHKDSRSEDQTFTIKQDKRKTALQVEVRQRNKRLSAGEHPSVLSSSRIWTPRGPGSQKCFDLRLGNYAESGDGAVFVRNFTLTVEEHPPEPSSENDPPRLRPELVPVGASLNDIFLVDVTGKPADQVTQQTLSGLKSYYVFPDRQRSYADFEVRFRHNMIESIPNDIGRLQCTVAFDYLETKGTLEDSAELDTLFREEGRYCSFTIEFEIEKDPGPYWLAIDLGTSAAVVAFDKQAERKLYRLNLQKQLETYENPYDKKEIPEFGTPFLSSTVLLKVKGGCIAADDRRDDLVYLAPGRRKRGGTHVRTPYLKALIGTEKMPLLNARYRQLEYQYKTTSTNGDEGQEPGSLIKFTDKPLPVKDILTSTYNRLLKDYVVPIIKKDKRLEELNKVIFTIPNTFTPRHIDYLKQLIKEGFSEYFNENYIAFLSESDAVACHYIAEWPAFNKKRSPDQQSRYKTEPEYVLIYDMGAGTLDITWLKIVPQQDKDSRNYREVTILGRAGTTTAGNYLDHTIANAIFEQHSEMFSRTMFGVTLDPVTLESRMEYKYFVKDELKPNLDENRTITIPMPKDLSLAYLTDPFEVNTAEINDSPEVREYIQINTRDVLANFFELFKGVDQNGETDEEVQTYRKGEFPLDTVVLSGRGIQFKPLQRALREEIQQWAHDDDITFIDDLDETTLKSAVVEGALHFATLYRHQGERARVRIKNKNIQARYGILYLEGPGQWAFKELLNPSTLPVSEQAIVKDGITIYQYDTDIYDVNPNNDDKPNYVDLGDTAVGYFVQSYAVDTAHEFQDGNTDYITVMFDFTLVKTGYLEDPEQVPVRVVVTKENAMVVTIGDFKNDPIEPMRTKLQESKTFRNSMWPFLEVAT